MNPSTSKRPSTRSSKSLTYYASMETSDSSDDDLLPPPKRSFHEGDGDPPRPVLKDDGLDQTPEGNREGESEESEPIEPNSAQAWPRKHKIRNLLLYSLASFLVSIAQGIILPSIQDIGSDLGGNERSTAAILTLPLIVLGLVNMAVSPFSDTYGRRIFHILGLGIFSLASIACGFATDIYFLLGFRLLQAFGGAAPAIVGAGAVSDMFEINQRGQALSMFLLGPLIGPVMGPLLGGFLASIKLGEGAPESWRIIFYVVGGCGGLLFFITLLALKESLQPSSEKKGCPNPFAPLSFLRVYRLTLLIISLSIGFSGFFVVNIGFPQLLENDYGKDPLTVGLCYLPFGAGLVIGSVIGGRSADRIRRRGGTPEHRLLPSLLFIPLNGAGIIAQGWVFQMEPSLTIVLIISFFLGFTFILPRPGANTYCIEKLKVLLGKDVASSATGLIFGVMLPSSAVIAQASIDGVEALDYGIFLSIIGGALILSTLPIAWYVIRDVRAARLRKEASLLRKETLN